MCVRGRMRDIHCLSLDDKVAGLQQRVLRSCVCARAHVCVSVCVRAPAHTLSIALHWITRWRSPATCVACVWACVYMRAHTCRRTHTPSIALCECYKCVRAMCVGVHQRAHAYASHSHVCALDVCVCFTTLCACSMTLCVCCLYVLHV